MKVVTQKVTALLYFNVNICKIIVFIGILWYKLDKLKILF